jgi:hypothetical protein
MDISTIAAEIAASIMAACAPGMLPTSEMLLHKFVDVYGDVTPTEFEHRRICALVLAQIDKR